LAIPNPIKKNTRKIQNKSIRSICRAVTTIGPKTHSPSPYTQVPKRKDVGLRECAAFRENTKPLAHLPRLSPTINFSGLRDDYKNYFEYTKKLNCEESPFKNQVISAIIGKAHSDADIDESLKFRERREFYN
jgi:hypothetical protein